MVQMIKRLSVMQETLVRSLGWEDTLEKEMAAHSQQSDLEPKQCKQGRTHAMSGGKPSVTGTQQAHGSVICLQRPSLPTARLNK